MIEINLQKEQISKNRIQILKTNSKSILYQTILLTIMNRIKSKENINPNYNLKAAVKSQQQCGVKTRNQSRLPFKQHSINPQKSTTKINPTKHHIFPQKQKQPIKQQKKPSPTMPAQLYYQQEVISLINLQAARKFKKSKQLQQNILYKQYRTSLIQAIYKECVNFGLKAETFYLYVHFLDSFTKTDPGRRLSMENNIMASYSCFLMAMKYQEIYPPSIVQWLPAAFHEAVYRWEGKIIFALGFNFIHQSVYHFFNYWAQKHSLTIEQNQSCKVLIDSIVFNYDLMYRYEPQKLAKAIALLQLADKKKKSPTIDQYHTFESIQQKNAVINDIKTHIGKFGERILWITGVSKK